MQHALKIGGQVHKSEVLGLVAEASVSLNHASKDAVDFSGEKPEGSLVHVDAFVNCVFLL